MEEVKPEVGVPCVPYELYVKTHNLLMEAHKLLFDKTFEPKKPVLNEQFSMVSKLIESGALSIDEAKSSCIRIIEQYYSSLD